MWIKKASAVFITLVAVFSACVLFAAPRALADSILLHEIGRLADPAFPGEVNQIVVDENYIYASLDDGGFEIRDKATGIQLSRTRVTSEAFSVQFEIRGNYAFIADWYEGLTILDITDKASPIHVGGWNDYDPVEKYAIGVAIDEDDCYLSIRNHGIVTLDISDLTNPVETGFFEEPDSGGNGIMLGILHRHNQEDTLIATSYRGALVLDTSDPDILNEVEFIATSLNIGASYDPVNDYLYLGKGYFPSLMFKVYDVSNPESPEFYTSYGEDLPEGETHQVTIVKRFGDYLFVGDRYRELIVLDYSDPENPIEVGYFPLPDDVSRMMGGLTVDGDIAYLGTDRSGIIKIDLSSLMIPEPGALFLIASGLFGILGAAIRRKRKA